MIVFITATDTGVGKTYISKLLVSYLKDRSIDVDYLKPIETGVEDIPEDANLVASVLNKPWQECVLYTFKKPMSPYACIMDESRDIDIDFILNEIKTREKNKILIVEGAGGVSVPIKVGIDYAFMIKELKAVPVVVSRASLGTLNHSFLTYFYLKAKNIMPNSIVLNGFDYKEPSQYYNEKILKEMINDEVDIFSLEKNPSKEMQDKLAENIYKSIANF